MKIRAIALCAFVLTASSGPAKSASAQNLQPVKKIPLVQKYNPKTDEISDTVQVLTDSISITEAVARALRNNPELQISRTEIKVREARTRQEQILPNPELSIEVENFGGSGSLNGFEGMETTISLGQLFELGGKRHKRTKIAEIGQDMASLEYEIRRLEIVTRVRSRFNEALIAQRKTLLDRQLLELSQKFKTGIDTLVLAGRLSNAESARAQVELFNRELTLSQSAREFKNARRNLAATWGEHAPDFSAVKGHVLQSDILPDSENLLKALSGSPQLIAQTERIRKQNTETQLARAGAIPDPTLSAGYRYFNDSDDQAIVAGLSIPIPVFDRNQGGIPEAELRERQSREQLENLKNQLRAEVLNRMETLSNLERERTSIRNRIIPEAQKAYEIIFANYRLGKYALIDVLDAQRQLFDAEAAYLRTLAEMNHEVISLEGILGQSLDAIK